MEVKLKAESKYLINSSSTFTYRSIDTDGGDRREYYYHSKIQEVIPVIVKETEKLNDFFSRVFFSFDPDNANYVDYQRDGLPFFLIYDDKTFDLTPALAEALFLQYKNVAIAASKIERFIIEYNEDFLTKTAEVNDLIEHAQAILSAQAALKKKLQKEYFNEKNEFVNYDKNLQTILKETDDED